MLDDVRVKGLLFAQAQTQPVQMALSRWQRRMISCIQYFCLLLSSRCDKKKEGF